MFIIKCCITGLVLLTGTGLCRPAPVIGGYETDSIFPLLTGDCLAGVRSGTYLFGSRSYGQNMLDGIERYGKQDDAYFISQEQYDVREGGTGAVPDNAFAVSNIVHELCTIDGYERVDEFAELVRRFAGQIDIAMLEAWPGWPNTTDPEGSLEKYGQVLDSLRIEHPEIIFVYHTRHMASDPDAFSASSSRNSAFYREMLFDRYRGVVPIYDFYDVMSTRSTSPSAGEPCVRYTDGSYNYADCVCTRVDAGDTLRMCCPEYDNGINGHPSTEVAELRFGRSLYVLWASILCTGATNIRKDELSGYAFSVDPLIDPDGGLLLSVPAAAEYIRVGLVAMDGTGARVCHAGALPAGMHHLTVPGGLSAGTWLVTIEWDGITRVFKTLKI